MVESRAFKAAILSFGKFLATLTTLVTIAILSRILTKADYAAYRQTLLAFNFVIPLLTLGLPQALYYFLPKHKNKLSVLSGNLLLLFLMGFMFLAGILLGGNVLLAKRFSNPNLEYLLRIFSPYALFALPILAIDACLVSNNKIKILTTYNILSKIIIFACVLGLVFIWRTAIAAVLGQLLGVFLIFFPAIFLMYQTTGKGSWKPNRQNLKEQLNYSIPLGISGMIGIISVNLDKILVSSLTSPEEFAGYVNGAVELPMVGIVTGSIISVLLAEFPKMYKANDLNRIKIVWHSAMVKSALIFFPLMIFLLILAPEVMEMLFSSKYQESVHPFRVYLLLLPMRITQFGAIYMAAGKNRLMIFRAGIGLGINIILTIILINLIGSVGAAIATLMVRYLWGVSYNLHFIKSILNLDYKEVMPIKKLGQVIGLAVFSAIVFIPLHYIRYWGAIPTIMICGAFYSTIVLMLYNHFSFINLNQLYVQVKGRLR